MMTLVVSSYNSLRSCWEPIVDATNSYLKFVQHYGMNLLRRVRRC